MNESTTAASPARSKAVVDGIIKKLKNDKDNKVHILGVVLETLLRSMDRIRNLEDDVEVLRDSQLHYEGVYSKSQQYTANAITTHRGTLWIATKTTRSTPGGGPDTGWKLMTKTPMARGKS